MFCGGFFGGEELGHVPTSMILLGFKASSV